MLPDIGLIFANYLIGSIPFGLIVSKYYRGIDPRAGGSGNTGATNVLRVVGKGCAILTVICDLAKGIPLIILGEKMGVGHEICLLIAMSAVLGHVFSIFLRFKGGKGVATSLGVFLVIAPKIALAGLLIWIVTFLLSRVSSVGALCVFGALPFLTFFFRPEKPMLAFATMIAILIYFRHWENILRLIQGTEKKINS